MNDLILTPTDFVAVLNQSLEYAYPIVNIEGELANYKVNRNRWVYFDIKDEISSLKCFGAAFKLPGPLEDGMMIRISAQPRLHHLYGFSLNLLSVAPIGEGSLKKAADLLRDKLEKEGLFDETRKRVIPFAPNRVGLITSSQAAAYSDFIKILDARWGGVEIIHFDVQVQGDQAVDDISRAIKLLNQLGEPPEVLVLTRGGGSPEDLAAFNNEKVVRAVAASRIPILVAVGHENDISLAELVADLRASTPSNAAELLVPDKKSVGQLLVQKHRHLNESLSTQLNEAASQIREQKSALAQQIRHTFLLTKQSLDRQTSILKALDPQAALRRGYAVIRSDHNKFIRSVKSLNVGQTINLQLHDGSADANISRVK